MTIPTASIYQALAGGILIGLAASLLLWLNGRIAGASNIAGGVFPWSRDSLWRLLFLVGLVGGAALYYFVWGNAPTPRAHFPAWLLAAAGLLVGFGTSLGSGCTSGHGVCGIGRLSPRSLVATFIFVLVAIVVTFIVRQVAAIS